MNNGDYKAFIGIINRTALIKDANFTKERADAWFDDLMQFDIDVHDKAFKEARGARWGFPDIADIKRVAAEIQKDKAWVYTQEYLEDQARIERIGAEERAELDEKLSGIKRLTGEATE